MTDLRDEFFANNGWSAHLFLDHARFLVDNFPGEIEFFREEIRLKANNKSLQLFVHLGAYSEEFVSIVDPIIAKPIGTFHHTSSPETILDFINRRLK